MAFDLFNESGSNFGGGPSRYTLGLFQALDYDVFCKEMRDNVHALPHTVLPASLDADYRADFDPLTYNPPVPCDMIGVWDYSTFKGMYCYGKLLGWDDGLQRMRAIASAHKVAPLLPDMELGYIVQSGETRFLSLTEEMVAVIDRTEDGQRHYVWPQTGRPQPQRRYRPG